MIIRFKPFLNILRPWYVYAPNAYDEKPVAYKGGFRGGMKIISSEAEDWLKSLNESRRIKIQWTKQRRVFNPPTHLDDPDITMFYPPIRFHRKKDVMLFKLAFGGS